MEATLYGRMHLAMNEEQKDNSDQPNPSNSVDDSSPKVDNQSTNSNPGASFPAKLPGAKARDFLLLLHAISQILSSTNNDMS